MNDILSLRSDGVRYAWVPYWRDRVGDVIGVVVFDTLRGRSFELAEPARGRRFRGIGGGLALWECFSSSPSMLLTDLSTGESRAPAALDEVKRMETFPGLHCGPYRGGTELVGRYWLALSCGTGFGPGDEPFYLNHRTGRLTETIDPYSPNLPFIDLDYVGLFRRYCAPGFERSSIESAAFFDYAPPFALLATRLGEILSSIRLLRCGSERAEVLSRCSPTRCRAPRSAAAT